MRDGILFVVTEFPPGPGGIGNHAFNLASCINKYSTIDVLAVTDYVNLTESNKFDSKQPFIIIRFKRYKTPVITYLIRIIELIKRLNKYKYSHCLLSGRFSLWMALIIRYICFDKRIKLIAILHGSELRPKNRIFKFLLTKSLKKVNLIISVSRFTERLIPRVIKDKTKLIIPNGIDIIKFNANNTKKISWMKGKPCFLTIGSLTVRKGQINFIKALPSILEQFPNAHYNCFGLKLEEKKILKVINNNQVQDHVSLHGFIDNNRLVNIYKQADILILLSQTDEENRAEGFGISILEANALGTVAIGSRRTGIEDAIKHNESGILVDPFNKMEILAGINSILERKQEFSTNAKKWAALAFIIDFQEIENESDLPSPGDEYYLTFQRGFHNSDSIVFNVEIPETVDESQLNEDMENILVVPNPYIAANVMEPALGNMQLNQDRRIMFTHIPSQCNIKIYTLSGILVDEIKVDNTLVNSDWDLTSSSTGITHWDLLSWEGLEVAAGWYIYLVESLVTGHKKMGKFAIIK